MTLRKSKLPIRSLVGENLNGGRRIGNLIIEFQSEQALRHHGKASKIDTQEYFAGFAVVLGQ